MTPTRPAMSGPSRPAIHEAGHALVACHWGYRLGTVRLLEPGTGPLDGWCLVCEKLGEVEPDEWTAYLLAGEQAVRVLDRDAIADGEARRGATEDIRRCRELLEAIDPSTADLEYRRAENAAWRLVMKHAQLIHALAVALDARRVLSGDDVRACIRDYAERRHTDERHIRTAAR